MTTGMSICTHLTSIENIQKLMTENNTKDVWVVDSILEKHLIGSVNQDDILKRSEIMDVDPTSLTVEQCMKPIIFLAREDITIEECDRILSDNNLEHLPIVDEKGHLRGVYNPMDLLPIRQ